MNAPSPLLAHHQNFLCRQVFQQPSAFVARLLFLPKLSRAHPSSLPSLHPTLFLASLKTSVSLPGSIYFRLLPPRSLLPERVQLLGSQVATKKELLGLFEGVQILHPYR